VFLSIFVQSKPEIFSWATLSCTVVFDYMKRKSAKQKSPIHKSRIRSPETLVPTRKSRYTGPESQVPKYKSYEMEVLWNGSAAKKKSHDIQTRWSANNWTWMASSYVHVLKFDSICSHTHISDSFEYIYWSIKPNFNLSLIHFGFKFNLNNFNLTYMTISVTNICQDSHFIRSLVLICSIMFTNYNLNEFNSNQYNKLNSLKLNLNCS